MVTLTGKLTDVISRPPDSISSITVKAPSARIGRGDSIVVTSHAQVDLNKDTGTLTLSGLHVGLSWLYIEGDGWTDSIPLAVAEGFQLILEAVANASGVPGIADYVLMIRNSESHALLLARAAVDGEIGDVVRLAQAAATTASQAATSADVRATSAENTVDAYTPRVDALEAMAGLSPESPVDGQTANLISQGDSLTRAAAENAIREVAVTVGEAPVNVQRYGGDLQAALDAAGTAISGLGGEVYAPAGTYTGSFNVPDNVKLSGAGQRATRLRGVGANTVLTVGRGSHVSDLYVLGDRTPGGVGVAFRPAEIHVTLRNLSVNGHDTGILLNDSWVCQIEQTTVQACGTGIRMRGINNAVQVNGGEIQNCVDGVLQEPESSGWGVAFRTTIEGNSGQGVKLLGRSSGFSFTDCYFESNEQGHLGVHFTSGGLRIAGSMFLNRAEFGIRADGSLVDGLVVENNLFNLNGTGDPRAIYVGPGGKNTYVSGNFFTAGSKGAFSPDVDYEGIRLSWHQDNRITMAPSARTQSAGGASLNIPHGESPTSPNDGDVWTTSEGMFVRINGVTKKITPDTEV